jgi:polar amino acid transport system permease protein
MQEWTGIWSWDFVLQILPKLLSAVKITISATFLGFLIALVLGLIFALMRRSSIKMVSMITGWGVEFIRSTPLLLQLFFVYYTLPIYGINLEPFTAGILTLGIHYSTYLSEVYRAGIEAVPKGQWEAAKALNFSKSQTWLSIILPQAIPPVVPMLGNYLIVMFKETPLLAAIGTVELLQTAKLIGSEYFRYLEAFTLVGLIFLVLSYPSSLIVQRLERWMNHRYKQTI